MNLALPFVGDLENIRTQLRALAARINTVWGKEHNPATGGHVFPETNWTPTLTFGGASVGMVYTLQVGRSLQAGKLMTISARIDLSAKGSSTGAAVVRGLPVVSSPFTTYNGAVVAGAMSGLTSPITVRVAANASVMDLYDWGATGIVALDDTNFTNTSVILLTLTYVTA